MRFCTVINCMDGRVQLPVILYLQERFDAGFVDSVTEPGPNLILAEGRNAALTRSILHRVRISVEKHGSVGIAVAGHHDCAGNPSPEEEQIRHTRRAVEFLRREFPGMEIVGLWVGEDREVREIEK